MRQFLAAALAAISLLPALPAFAQQAKTLRRELDPAVVSGDVLKPLWGAKADNLRLFAKRKGQFEVIPFQIDEKDPDGEFLINTNTIPEEVQKEVDLDDVPEADKRKKRIKKFEKNLEDYREDVKDGKLTQQALDDLRRNAYWDEKPGEFDYNDELVFMVRDSGARVARAEWGASQGVEIEISDPVDGGKSWAYLLSFPSNPPPLNPLDYIAYYPKTDTVDGRMGEVDFMDDKPMIAESIVGKMPDGTRIPNVLDRFKLRIRILLTPLFCIPMNFDENNSKAFTIGYKDGPVRVIRRNVFWAVLKGIKVPFFPNIVMYFQFYENGLATEAKFRNPINLKWFVCGGSRFTAGLDLRKSAYGSQVFTRDNRGDSGMILDGRMSEAEKRLSVANQFWIAGFLPNNAALMSRMRYDPELIRRGAILDLYYLDDEASNDGPENEPGQHIIGYTMDIRKFPAGTYHMGFQVYQAFDFKPGQEQELLNIDDKPLQVKAGSPE